jgi:hypothetical protein
LSASTTTEEGMALTGGDRAFADDLAGCVDAIRLGARAAERAHVDRVIGCAGGHGREGERREETITVDRRNEMAYPLVETACGSGAPSSVPDG